MCSYPVRHLNDDPVDHTLDTAAAAVVLPPARTRVFRVGGHPRSRAIVMAALSLLATMPVALAVAVPVAASVTATDASTCTFGGRYRPACQRTAGAADGWFEAGDLQGPRNGESTPVRNLAVR